MATAPVTPAIPVETAQQKIDSFFTKFGDVLRNVFNAGANIAIETLPAIEPLIPVAYQPTVVALVTAAVQQVAAADAKYAAIGASTVPMGVKIAEAVAVGGTGILAIAAQGGLKITTDLPTFFAAATTIAQSLNLATLTTAPVVPVTTTQS
jgi:hypothetical protein